MSSTVSLYNILESELVKAGLDPWFNKETNQLIKHGGSDAIIYRLASFDDDSYKVVNKAIFAGVTTGNDEADRYFKHMFVTRFMLREIKFQTLDIFRAKATSLLLSDSQYINQLFTKYDQLVNGTATGNTKANSNSNGSKEERSANSTLPQDNTGLDLNNDVVDYADDTRYLKEKHQDESNSNQDSFNEKVDVNNLLALRNEWEKVLNKYDYELFRQIW